MESLSPAQARKLVLHSQQLPPGSQKGSALAATQQALDHLGYIQIDTISVIERAHHHTLWTRNPRYTPACLDQLIADKTAFEYWSHAAAYLPMRDYRFSLPRKHALKTGQQTHWYQCDERMLRYVMDRIRAEGPLMAKDFDRDKQKTREWQKKPAKQALDHLFMQGELMIPERRGFHKVYELTERVLPTDIDDSLPTPQEHAHHLITGFLRAHGLAQENEFSYLLKGVKPAIKTRLHQMLSDNEVCQIRVGKTDWFALPESLTLLDKPLTKSKLKILSPFDNLLIQRQRMRDLFDFDYQIECYVPAAKRKFGYFVLPLLWDGKLIARMDCKADRKTGVLNIHSLHIEPSLQKTDEFLTALNRELPAFMRFNGSKTLHYAGPWNIDNTLSCD
ncbi:MAG: winged helix-turn-helix domain-containing protein [Thiolinea sp.]